MKNTLVIGNSFSRLVGFPEEVLDHVNTILTFQKDIQYEKSFILKKLQYFKKLSQLKDIKTAAKGRKMLHWYGEQLKELEKSEFTYWLQEDEFPTGHLNIVKDVLEAFCKDYKIEDNRIRPEKSCNFYMKEELPEPRYYQKEFHEIAMKTGRGVYSASVASGKTLSAMWLVRDLGVRSLIIAPSKDLVMQWAEELEKYFGERNVEIIDSKTDSIPKIRKMRKKFVRITNIQALVALQKKELLGEILKDVELFFIDEIHHAASNSYTNILPELDHIYHRFGCSGTFLRPDGNDLAMWGVLSTVLYDYPPTLAVKDGFITPIEVIVHQVEGIEKKKYQSEYRENYCGGEALLDEISEIFTKWVKEGEQVLILVNQKENAGLVIHEFLEELGLGNVYVTGDDDKEGVRQAISDFNDKKINILIGSKVIGEGINVRSSDHLIMAQGQKSEIAITQAVGRLVRLYEGKEIGHLHDFRFLNTNYMEKHLEERLEIYKKNFAPKKIVEV